VAAARPAASFQIPFYGDSADDCRNKAKCWAFSAFWQGCQVTFTDNVISGRENLESQATALFAHPIGQREYIRRNVTPDRLCGFEVEHELKRCRLLDWQIRRFGAYPGSQKL
jgi:hypothetical protein